LLHFLWGNLMFLSSSYHIPHDAAVGACRWPGPLALLLNCTIGYRRLPVYSVLFFCPCSRYPG
jgi:hypothetical protein